MNFPQENYKTQRAGSAQQTAAFLLCLTGTGGCISPDYAVNLHRTGFNIFLCPTSDAIETPEKKSIGISVELESIRKTLRLSVSDTALLFNVSRPTIYSWQSGGPISTENIERLRMIIAELEPHTSLFETQPGSVAHRAVEGRITLLQKLSRGANPKELFASLAGILNGEQAQRERLAVRLRSIATHGAPDIDAFG